jgi:uncharacterized protein (DUF2147 family)
MKRFLFCICFFAAVSAYSQTFNADMILGTWIPKKGDSRVKIEKIGNKYYGKVIWLENPNEKDGTGPDLDDKNPDETMRKEPILGSRVLKDFSFEGDGVFKGGKAYDPNNGKTYCGKITIIDADHIDMRGSICGFSILGRTETWTRYKEK